MADLDRSISQFPAASALDPSSLLFLSEEDISAASGYQSKYINAGTAAQNILASFLFPLLFDTTAKNAIGAINEVFGLAKYTALTGTITAGSTSVTISSAAILDTSLLDIYTDPLIPIQDAVVPSGGGSVTITVEEQAANVSVLVLVREVS